MSGDLHLEAGSAAKAHAGLGSRGHLREDRRIGALILAPSGERGAVAADREADLLEADGCSIKDISSS